MTKQEFLKALEDLKQKAEASSAFDEPSVPWEPKSGEPYYTIIATGEIVECSNGDDYTEKAYANGNVFKTREQAEKFAKKRAARNRLELIAEKLNAGWEPGEGKELYYVYGEDALSTIGRRVCTKSNDVYFKSKELAEQALTYLTDDEKFQLWGVKC